MKLFRTSLVAFSFVPTAASTPSLLRGARDLISQDGDEWIYHSCRQHHFLADDLPSTFDVRFDPQDSGGFQDSDPVPHKYCLQLLSNQFHSSRYTITFQHNESSLSGDLINVNVFKPVSWCSTENTTITSADNHVLSYLRRADDGRYALVEMGHGQGQSWYPSAAALDRLVDQSLSLAGRLCKGVELVASTTRPIRAIGSPMPNVSSSVFLLSPSILVDSECNVTNCIYSNGADKGLELSVVLHDANQTMLAKVNIRRSLEIPSANDVTIHNYSDYDVLLLSGHQLDKEGINALHQKWPFKTLSSATEALASLSGGDFVTQPARTVNRCTIFSNGTCLLPPYPTSKNAPTMAKNENGGGTLFLVFLEIVAGVLLFLFLRWMFCRNRKD